MDKYYTTTLEFTTGKVELQGTSVFLLSRLADLEKKEGLVKRMDGKRFADMLEMSDNARRHPNVGDVVIGAVVAGMDNHVTQFGALKGWIVEDPIEVSQAAAMKIISGMPTDKDADNPVIGNKYARAFSLVRDPSNGELLAAVVVYAYDEYHYIATLKRPE